jgi:tetratricopeptide (TPR) repeat protein
MRIAFILAIVLVTGHGAAGQIVDERTRREAIGHYRAGQEFLSAEQWDKAAAEFQAAIKRDQLMTDAYYGLGQAFVGLERYASAAQAFTACITAAQSIHGLRAHGRVVADRSIDEEIREVRDTIRRMLQNGGGTPLKVQRLERHIEYLLRSRSSASGGFDPPPMVLLALGSAHYRNGDVTRAEQSWLEATRVDERFGEAWNNLAAVYAQTGRRAEAQQAVRNAERAGFRVHPRLKDDIAALARQ